MSVGDGLRIFMIVVGLVILGATVISLSRRHMTESFCIAWGVIAVAAICAGIILRPTEWSKYFSWGGLMLILFGVIVLLAGAFFVSVRISRLTRQVRELAIQVSLLNQENAQILQAYYGDPAQDEIVKHEEKDLIRH